MPGNDESAPQLEIGHVLAVDVVGYSKLLINEQSDLLQHLNEIVRSTKQFRAADTQGKLIRLPTGDGIVLVFFGDPKAPIECAAEIATALKNHPEIQLRMGIHSGPVNEVLDVNERANVAGAGIDFAQRVMDCGNAGHILLSKRVADDLAPYARWHSHLHELGECEVKHGHKISLVNFYTSEIGNPTTPEKLQAIPNTAQPTVVITRNRKGLLLAIGVIALLALLVGSGWFLFRRATKPIAAVSTASVPEKSIAVLPFENLSEEKKNAYFADGIQDEILTDLAKIADLKVISRTSVMQYKSGAARNLREIGKQLGVAHVLEGSVQRIENEVRVNAQLIDARTDAHLWAQTYDRNLADVFAIQSEIAKRIAEQLQAKLAPEEKTRLETKPTDNSEAYLLYLQANEIVHAAASKQEVVTADKIYAQAIALDPNFALAQARASILNSLMYLIGRDATRRTRARALADEALRLAPDLGEAHLALGLCLYRIDRNYDSALKELAIASAASPNDSEILDSSGYIYRRQGRWREALDIFQRALKLDPRRAHFDGLPSTFRLLRQWEAAIDGYNHGLELEPNLVDGWVGLAYIQFAQSGKPADARETLDRLPDAQKNKADVKLATWDCTMLAHDFETAEKICPDEPVDEFPAFEPKPFFLACVAFARGDLAQGRRFLEEILPLHEDGARTHPDDAKFHVALARVYALLGRKDEAIGEAQRAIKLCPKSQDAIDGPDFEGTLAFVYAQVGETDQAVTLLSRLLVTPSGDRITLAHLRLSWEWDPLRKDARFQKILEGPEPQTVYK